jgi:hypothetical protein
MMVFQRHPKSVEEKKRIVAMIHVVAERRAATYRKGLLARSVRSVVNSRYPRQFSSSCATTKRNGKVDVPDTE